MKCCSSIFRLEDCEEESYACMVRKLQIEEGQELLEEGGQGIKESNRWDQAGPSSPPGPTFELGQHCKSL